MQLTKQNNIIDSFSRTNNIHLYKSVPTTTTATAKTTTYFETQQYLKETTSKLEKLRFYWKFLICSFILLLILGVTHTFLKVSQRFSNKSSSSSSSSSHVGQTSQKLVNVCTDNIIDLIKVKPSATTTTTTTNTSIPNIIDDNGIEYNGDAEHFVIGNSESLSKDMALVYLPGTTSRPEVSSCLLSAVSAHMEYPTIGLSYKFLNSNDASRNLKCASLRSNSNSGSNGIGTTEDVVECLSQQHEDAIFGGTYGYHHFDSQNKSFWDVIEPENSISGRLGLLLQYMDERYPDNGWGSLYNYYTPTGVQEGGGGENGSVDVIPIPIWSKFIIMGHSQGASHTAYMAKKFHLQGAVMISGPQDECIDCPEGTTFWIDGDDNDDNDNDDDDDLYNTHKCTAFANGEESAYDVIVDNWDRMSEAGATTWSRGTRTSTTKTTTTTTTTTITDVDFALEMNFNVCQSPLVTYVEYADTSSCSRKYHCSTALDGSAPYIEQSNGKKFLLYELYVWPLLSKNVTNCFG